jgi:hypothetical protein
MSDIKCPTSTSNTVPRTCFWFQQGKCFLFEVPTDWVFNFLFRNKGAREDLLRCASDNHCSRANEEWFDEFISFAESGITLQDAIESSDKWQRYVNQFIDRHRSIQQGQVFRKPKT